MVIGVVSPFVPASPRAGPPLGGSPPRHRAGRPLRLLSSAWSAAVAIAASRRSIGHDSWSWCCASG